MQHTTNLGFYPKPTQFHLEGNNQSCWNTTATQHFKAAEQARRQSSRPQRIKHAVAGLEQWQGEFPSQYQNGHTISRLVGNRHVLYLLLAYLTSHSWPSGSSKYSIVHQSPIWTKPIIGVVPTLSHIAIAINRWFPGYMRCTEHPWIMLGSPTLHHCTESEAKVPWICCTLPGATQGILPWNCHKVGETHMCEYTGHIRLAGQWSWWNQFL